MTDPPSSGSWRRRAVRAIALGTLGLAVGCGADETPAESPATDAPKLSTRDETGTHDVRRALPPTGLVAPEPEPLPPELQLVLDLVGERQFATARLRAQRYLEKHPDDGRATFLIGFAHHRARDYALAEPFFVRAAELEPDYHPVHHFLGYCRFHQGNLDGARAAFETHLRWMPQESDTHFGLGLIDLEEAKLDDAEARFRHAMALIDDLEHADPGRYAVRRKDRGKCQARLGDIALARGAYAEAAELFQAAIDADPDQYTAYYGLSLALRRLGNDAAADEMLEEYESRAAPRTQHRGTRE